MDIQSKIKEVYEHDNYIFVIFKSNFLFTTGFYVINNFETKESLSTVDSNDLLFKTIDREKIKNGVTIIEPNNSSYIDNYNPELLVDDLFDLVIFQKTNCFPSDIYRKETLKKSIRKEKIKDSLVYACYINDQRKILELAGKAKPSELDKKLQYTGTPLGFCAEHDFLEGFKKLVGLGANINKKSLAYTPIEIAFSHSDDIVFYLRDFHSEDLTEVVKKRGFLLALQNKNIKIFEMLLHFGADIVGKDPFFPVLHSFSDFDNLVGMKFILDHGFNINLKNKHNQTALQRAIQQKKIQSISFLENYTNSQT